MSTNISSVVMCVSFAVVQTDVIRPQKGLYLFCSVNVAIMLAADYNPLQYISPVSGDRVVGGISHWLA